MSSQNVPDVNEFMTAVLVTHRKYLNMTQTVFCNHKAFLSALHEVVSSLLHDCSGKGSLEFGFASYLLRRRSYELFLLSLGL